MFLMFEGFSCNEMLRDELCCEGDTSLEEFCEGDTNEEDCLDMIPHDECGLGGWQGLSGYWLSALSVSGVVD